MAHHMTSIDNLHSIFAEGGLLPYGELRNRRVIYKDLSLTEVQRRRSLKTTPCGRSLHDYIPLYYSYKTPMAAKRQDCNSDWVYLTFDIAQISRSIAGVVITNGNAASDSTVMINLNSIDDFGILDKKALYSTAYAGNPELGLKKSAEMLIPDKLSLDFVIYISAIDSDTLTRVAQIVQPFNRQNIKYQVKHSWFFTGNAQPGEGSFFV